MNLVMLGSQPETLIRDWRIEDLGWVFTHNQIFLGGANLSTVTIGIGLPGSGKTTYLVQLAVLMHATYISSDDIRFELTANVADHSREGDVWAEVYRRIHAELDAGRDVVVDTTNAKQPDRSRLLVHCRQKAARIEGVWFKAPYSICIDRNRSRDRVVPDFAVGLMAGWLEAFPPTEAEGFDRLVEHETYSPK